MKIVIVMKDSITQVESTCIRYDEDKGIVIDSYIKIMNVKAERPTFEWIQQRILGFAKEIRIDCRGDRPTIFSLNNNDTVDDWVD